MSRFVTGLLVVLAGYLLWNMQSKSQDLRVAIDAMLKENTAHRKEITSLKAQLAQNREAYDKQLGEVIEDGAALDLCHKDLKRAQNEARPCPASCNLPDCRVVRDMLEGYSECLAFVERVKTLTKP